MNNIRVYGFVRYDRSGKVTWALGELGVKYDFVSLDYEKNQNKSEDHLRRHPLGRVPVLEFDDITMHESDAICLYLAERFPGSTLLPDVGTKDRAACLQWLQYSEATLGSAKMYKAAFRALPDYPADATTSDGKKSQDVLAEAKKEAEQEFRAALGVLEGELAQKEYLCGSFTVADIAIAYSLAWTKKVGGLQDFPALREYVDRNRLRPAAIRSGAFENK